MQSGLLEFEYFKLQAELANTQAEIVLLKRELDEEKIKSARSVQLKVDVYKLKKCAVQYQSDIDAFRTQHDANIAALNARVSKLVTRIEALKKKMKLFIMDAGAIMACHLIVVFKERGLGELHLDIFSNHETAASGKQSSPSMYKAPVGYAKFKNETKRGLRSLPRVSVIGF